MISLTALLFLAITLIGCLLALSKGPIWGILTYIFVYLVPPNPKINWWARDLPTLRWSVIIALICLVSLILYRDKLSNISLGRVSAGKALISFLLLSVIVSFNAVDSDLSFSRCYDFLRYIIVFYLIIKSLKSENDFVIIMLLLMVCGLQLGYTAYVTPRNGPRLEDVGPPDAADANNLGLLFASMIPLALPFYKINQIHCKVIAVFSLIFMTNGLILCNSRGATLGLVVGFLSIILLVRLPGFRSKAFLAAILMICVFLYLADQTFLDRFSTINDTTETDQGSGRLVIWQHGLQIARDYPFGTGGHGFEILSPQYIPKEWLTTGGTRASHNTFLLVLVEQGFIGLSIYIWFIFSILLNLFASYKIVSNQIKIGKNVSEKTHFFYLLIVSLYASILCFIVGSVFGDRLYYEFIYILSAIAVAVHGYVNLTYVTEVNKFQADRPKLNV